jgi:NADPH-dependent 2,4-dienoyl-CoA reductase/sulfur reductase-like enzyme/nitrite reductase/ring-hydroxylating ferredoxin subunit
MPDDQHKPDLLAGVALDAIPDGGLLAGRIGEHDAVLVRHGTQVRALGGRCTHLGAPLAEGSVVGDEVRCPWHHACFDTVSGRATRAPAFAPLPTWPVAVDGGRVRVTSAEPVPAPAPAMGDDPGPFVIVGGGAAGYAAAVALKTAAPRARCIVLSADAHAPYDRTLLTKDYLDGKFGDDRLPISAVTLESLGVELKLGTRVARIDRAGARVVLTDGETVPYAALLLATGAEPKRLDVPGADREHVRVLRDLDDCRAILARVAGGGRVVVLGSSFIGLETAASLRSRGVDVTVVTPETEPTAAIFGQAVSRAIMAVHRANGVAFVTGRRALAVGASDITLDDGTRLPADLVVVGTGVTPRTGLAEAAGLAVDDGVRVDALLRTSDPAIYAAGDIALWPDPHTGRDLRVEHWVVAQRQGQVAAANMLGGATPFTAVPFFWTKHFDLSVRYVGHAGPEAVGIVDGSPDERDAAVWFLSGKGGRAQDAGAARAQALATLGRDRLSLAYENELEGTG